MLKLENGTDSEAITLTKPQERKEENKMIKYIDNGQIPAGWYYVKEGCCYGNGTREDAERIENIIQYNNKI